jgi:membrane protease YdiL (CAAX protease family)
MGRCPAWDADEGKQMQAGPEVTRIRGSRARRWWAAFSAGPVYPPSEADRRTVRIVGVELPTRATTALFLAVFLVLFDYQQTFIPAEIRALGLVPEAIRFQAYERLVLFGVIPLLVVLVAFRDIPGRYGLRLGDWRWGLPLAILGCTLMTPVVIGLVADPTFAAYYAPFETPIPDLLLTNLIDLAPSEFLVRGFLMFTLFRAIGPVGMVVAQMPFVFAHIGKPELELFSTMFGGLAYAWLDWRTGSIVWSVVVHVFILSLAIVLSAAAAAG